MRLTLTVVLLALLLPAAPAGAERSLPDRAVLDDSGDGDDVMRVRLDRVVVTSGVKGRKQATVKAELSGPRAEGEGLAVWFNLDRDPVPEVLTYHVSGDLSFETHTMSSWTQTKKDISGRCFKVRPAGASADVVRFDPHCFGRTRSFQVSVGLYVTVGEGMLADFAPREHVWSKRIRSYA